MNLTSRAMRDGEPVACALLCRETDTGLRAGLLFVRDGVPAEPLDFTDDTGKGYRLTLPKDFHGLSEDGWGADEELQRP